VAQLSDADEHSLKIQVDSVPEGFKVVQLKLVPPGCRTRHSKNRCHGAMTVEPKFHSKMVKSAVAGPLL
jgi:hypothetical protein